MSPLLLRSSRRFFIRHPWQLGLTLLSIALGTAVMVAVDLANSAATRSFDRSIDVLSGPMSHEITAADGSIAEDVYRTLRLDRRLRRTLPLVEGRIEINGDSQEVVGTDPFALTGMDLGASAPSGLEGDTLRTLLTEPGGVVIPQSLARTLGIGKGDTLTATTNVGTARLRVLAITDPGPGSWLADRILADIATAQDVLGKPGSLSRIQLKLTDAEAAALDDSLPAALQLEAYQQKQATFAEMTEAFRVNLAAMSLLAVLVGVFLVYNTMTFAALQRRQAFAVMRMTGASGGQLFRLLLVEAGALGLIGSAIGVALGMALGQGLLVLVSRTISDLYVEISPTQIDLAPAMVLRSVAITLFAVLAATLVPARSVARAAPVIAERRSQQETGGRTPWLLLSAGVAGMLASLVLIALSGQSLVAGFSALFVFVVGYSLCIPPLMLALLRGCEPLPLFRRSIGRLALRGVQSSLSRTGLATVALAIAVSATVGVGLMTGSFRASVADWLDTTLGSDLYVSAAADSQGERRLDTAWLKAANNVPGVSDVSTGSNRDLQINGETVRALVLGAARHSARGFEFIGGNPEAARQQFSEGRALIVSEPLSYRQGISAGDRVRVRSVTSGNITLPVAGIYRDYSSSRGMVVLPRLLYERHWPDRDVSNLGISLAADARIDDVIGALQALAARLPGDAEVISNRAIRDSSLAIFDRTFVITDVLKVLVILVAFIGVFSALMALFLEKGREFAVLRATGMTPGQLQRLVLSQAALVGLLAGLLSVPLGGVLSEILIDVINRRSFGWTMQSHFFPAIALEAVLLSIVAALLAALYPTRRIGTASLRDRLAGL
ncbi:FtsX-like permease family protein [Chromatocurvus halotolerans]|uniref:Putative ABC transport system permease protein n=1 Tax=Chromatocurvus halotolerans TaxID=1132028 RepID=A0A4R2KW05_9GAMM|nr:FtsX-like permease family protein [Chromatocurvus halotolerans]TCO77162.1 putative ABC transport system permease protein [Chromatocurvus halotolerans]